MKIERPKSPLGNISGAFADGAVLFPLMALLASKTGMDGTILLASTGVAYIAASIFFCAPMPVQPLKSLTVAAIAMGATAAEVGAGGFIVGLLCLALLLFHPDQVARLVPCHLVHGLQAGLGVLLMTRGVVSGVSGLSLSSVLFIMLAVGSILAEMRGKNFLGWIALSGLALGIWFSFNKGAVTAPTTGLFFTGLRWDVLVALVLPQMALTLANSVIGTHDAAQRYFGKAAGKVSARNLLASIGIGNIIAAPIGGLPFCHGAGGLTAHVRGGASSWHMNLVIGGLLIVLASVSALLPFPLIPAYPPVLLGSLLAVVGWFHFTLMLPSWRHKQLRLVLLSMVLAALLTQNMLYVLFVGIAAEVIRHFKQNGMRKERS